MKYGKASISRGGSTTRRPAMGAVILANFRGTVRTKSVLANGEDRGQKERKTKRDATLYAKLRQRTIHHGLLTTQSFDQRVRSTAVVRPRIKIRTPVTDGEFASEVL